MGPFKYFVHQNVSTKIVYNQHNTLFLQVQPVKMKPFKILEFLSSKQTAEPFDVFCKLLMKIDCETVSHRLQVSF